MTTPSMSKVEAAHHIRNKLMFSDPYALEKESQCSVIAAQSRFNVIIPLKNELALAYNTMSSAFALWASEDLAVYEDISEGKLTVADPRAKPFTRGGFVVSEQANELATVEGEYRAARFATDSMMMTIAPTLSCNFGCEYCFQGQNKPVQKMMPAVVDATKAYVSNKIRSLKSMSVVWYGGEPLMGKSIIWDLSEHFISTCQENDASYGAMIVTNGYFLDVDTASRLLKAQVTSAQVTIDGAEEAHDGRRHLLSGKPTFQRIVENIEAVTAATDLRITVRVNIDELNAEGASDLLDEFARRGFGENNQVSVYFAPVEAMTEDCGSCAATNLNKKQYSELEVELKDKAFELGLMSLHKFPKYMSNCQAVKPNGILITPNGDLHKCWDTVSHPELRVGSILREQEPTEAATELKWSNWSPFDNDVCRECKLLPSCAGGCAFKTVHHEQTHGDAATLPCPSWKGNLSETLFMRAVKEGVVAKEFWDDDRSPTWVNGQSRLGASHTYETVRHASAMLASSDA